MASARERRAALQAQMPSTYAEAVARQDARMAAHVPSVPNYVDSEEEPMKIQFTSVNLHKSIERMHAGKGHWSATSTRHNATPTCVIELDTATGLVRISNGTACTYIPREGVENFGPTLDDAKAHADTLQVIARDAAKANEDAAIASQIAADQPA